MLLRGLSQTSRVKGKRWASANRGPKALGRGKQRAVTEREVTESEVAEGEITEAIRGRSTRCTLRTRSTRAGNGGGVLEVREFASLLHRFVLRAFDLERLQSRSAQLADHGDTLAGRESGDLTRLVPTNELDQPTPTVPFTTSKV